MGSLSGLKNVQIIILGLCIAGATIFSSLVISKGMMQIKKFSNEVIEVTGSADKKIVSDYIVWNSGFSRRDAKMTVAFDKLKNDLRAVKEYLLSKGVKEEEIIVPQVDTKILYKKNEKGNNTNEIEAYLISQAIEVRSYDVKKVDDIARQATELINQDIQFISASPEYFYTKLAELKHEMLAKATKDAKQRAEQMANSTGNKIGLMRSAKMGTFQINPVNSYDVSWYGNNDTSSYEKKVTAVVNVSFAIIS
ncbi:MAG: SIMPL domain-containing protein [Candidatus Omnitrophica bacterium]|nr:SIMPL domain-containing protein [Candidatus Omnitrophota bacterium]